MFYSQFILAKKGPLGTIWIAAHLERKLRKNQIADTDIGDSVDSILSPDVPIALRLSSHLLLGVVRIYNKKVNYLFDDCSEALLKIKQAFRSATVDLPPEESKAPYHSITLPETFDLDDFELPDSDIFQGNYEDHHISSKEQITLQDTMEGVNYSTSNFGLDERFGDGDASGLDLDEELLLDKVGSAGDADERVDPHTSFVLITPLKQDEHPQDAAADLETRVDDDGEDDDIMDYAQAPSTPGLVEQPNLSNVRDASACEDHLESEDHLMASAARENTNDVLYEEKQEVHWCSQNDMVPDVHQGPAQDTEHVSGGFEIEDSKSEGESVIGAHVLPENKIKEFDDPCQEDSQTEAVKDKPKDDNQGPNEIGLDESALETSGLVDSPGKQTSEGLAVEDVAPPVVDVSQGVVDSSVHRKSHNDDSVLGLEDQVGSFKEKPEIQVGEETICAPDFNVCNKEVANEALVLRPCNSERPCVMNPVSSMTTDVKFDAPLANFGGEETSLQVRASSVTENSEQNLKENQVEECVSGEEILASAAEANDQVHNAGSQNKLDENLENSTQLDLPAPEKLLSVPEGHNDLHGDILAEVSRRDFEELVEGDTGSKTAVGRKRTLTESTLTEQSLNSVESSRQVRAKRTVESVPDDDDLLSSILVGRRSSVFKVKTTPLSEVTSVKRNRTAPRPGPPKRKLVMDDSMVLHGDTIRKQLTSTEDIRRVRKKAPCTFPEISMIQKQHMEDEIFLQPCFTGVSAELVSLHSLVYDFSQIRVCQNDALDASLDIMTKLGQPSQNDESGGALEAKAEPNSTFCNDKHGASSEAVAELNLASPNKDIHDLEGDHGTMVVEESGQGLNTESSISRDNEMAESSLIPLPTENVVADNHSSVEVNIHQEQSKPSSGIGPDGLEQELSENVAAEEKSHINPALSAEIETLDFSGLAIDSKVDAYAVTDQRAEVHSVELDYAVVDGGQLVSRTEVLEKDGDASGEAQTLLAPDNDILQGAPDAVTAFDLAQDGNHREVEYNVHHENYDITYGEQREVDFSYPAAHGGLVDSLFDDGERINNQEAYHPNIREKEISGFDMRDEDELNYAAAGDDTEFLNLDDDELTEMADDYIPDAEEKQYTESSGWSSRTRAVSKYLQTAFTKEAERGRDSLSTNNLLAGKSRKEASRMFFETLVLKTRDYIQVEQDKPFDDITLKPRSRLMKSDF